MLCGNRSEGGGTRLLCFRSGGHLIGDQSWPLMRRCQRCPAASFSEPKSSAPWSTANSAKFPFLGHHLCHICQEPDTPPDTDSLVSYGRHSPGHLIGQVAMTALSRPSTRAVKPFSQQPNPLRARHFDWCLKDVPAFVGRIRCFTIYADGAQGNSPVLLTGFPQPA